MSSLNTSLQENAASPEAAQSTSQHISVGRREAMRKLGKITLYGAPLALLLMPKKAHGYQAPPNTSFDETE